MTHLHSRAGVVGLGITIITFTLCMLTINLRTTPTAAEDLQLTGTLEDWQFQYTIPQPDVDGTYFISYEYARATTADVEAAVVAMNRTAAQLARTGSPFKATLVFARPLAVEQFTAFARNNGLTPLNNIIRAVDPERGGVLKIGAPPEFEQDARGRFTLGKPKRGGKPIDIDGMAEFTKGRKSLRINGVISTDVMLDQATYEQVKRDPRVYAVDVMEHVLAGLVREKLADVPANQLVLQWSILYPAMEDTSIAPDPKQP